MGGIPGLDLSDPKQLADFARYDLSGTRFDDDDDNDHGGGDDDDDDPKQLAGLISVLTERLKLK